MFIEVIARNYEECQIIEQAGNIERIELCADLLRGGLTSSYAVIQECTERIKVPIRLMVRHCDADFYCPADECFQLKKDIAYIKTTKAEGIVVGILTPTHQIDLLRMEELIALAHPLAITFHRAFDLIEDKITAIQELVQLVGISTVLTQGGITPIMKNLVTLQSLRNYGVKIQGGSGINLTNYREISHYCDAIHLSGAAHYDRIWNTALDIIKLQQLK